MIYTTKQVIEAGLRGYLEGCGGPHAGTRTSLDDHQNDCVQMTEERALARCCAIYGFYDVVPLIMPYYRNELFWEVGRKLCGEYVASLSQSLKEDPFEPTYDDADERPAGHPYFIPATVAAAAIGIKLETLMQRKWRKTIDAEYMMTKGQRFWVRSDYVYSERDKNRKKVAA